MIRYNIPPERDFSRFSDNKKLNPPVRSCRSKLKNNNLFAVKFAVAGGGEIAVFFEDPVEVEIAGKTAGFRDFRNPVAAGNEQSFR